MDYTFYFALGPANYIAGPGLSIAGRNVNGMTILENSLVTSCKVSHALTT